MRIKEGITLRNVSGINIIVWVSEKEINYEDVFSLNETGTLLWKALERSAEREELLRILKSEYEVDEEIAREDIEEFLDKLRSIGALEE